MGGWLQVGERRFRPTKVVVTDDERGLLATGSTEEGSPLGFSGLSWTAGGRASLVPVQPEDIGCDGRGDYKQVGIRRGQHRLFAWRNKNRVAHAERNVWTTTRPRKPELGRGGDLNCVHAYTFVLGRLRPRLVCLLIGLFIYPRFWVLSLLTLFFLADRSRALGFPRVRQCRIGTWTG